MRAVSPGATVKTDFPMKMLFRSLFAAGLLVALAGCSTPPTYRTRADAATKLASAPRLGVAPPDVEVYEIAVGGVTELRDEWTQSVTQLLRAELAGASRFQPAPTPENLPPDAQRELTEVASLLRAISLNHLMSMWGPRELLPHQRPLDYSVGRIDALADACGTDALLFVFVRDSYATAGRKALAVLGVLTGAVTGIYLVPQLGSTVGSAALVHRDGTVLWFNVHGAGSGDLREREGAATTAQALLTGLPRT